MDDQSKRKATTVVHTVRRADRSAPSTPLPSQPIKSDNHRTAADVIPDVDPQLPRKLLVAVTRQDQKADAIAQVLAVIRDCHPAVSLLYIERDPSQELHVAAEDVMFEQLPIGAADRISQWAAETCVSGAACRHELSGAHSWLVYTVPVVRRGRPPEVLCAAVRKEVGKGSQLFSTLQMAAPYLTLWGEMKEASRAQTESRQTAALLELLTKLEDIENSTTASYVLVNELKNYLGCDRIALGMTRGNQVDCRLTAVTGLSDFDKRSEFTDQLEAVLNEAILRNQITCVSGQSDQGAEGTLAHQGLRLSNHCDTVISTPLYDSRGEVVGAWLLLDSKAEADQTGTIAFVRASQAVIGRRLAKLRLGDVHPVMRPLRWIARAAGKRKVAVALVGMILLIAAMMIPMDYRIGCHCQLEPVSRRFVAAPYDGTLNESMVEAGEIVSAGQILARMDARELRWELSGYEADYESEKKKRNAASARDEVALAQQSNLEMQRLSLKMDLLAHRLENLEIKSPIDGVVIAGDLKKAEGVPLTIGQNLFEIGPLDQMIVEVAVPESEILYVAEGMQVEIRLDADQSQMKTGTILCVNPRSETRDHESVYVAEVALDNTDGSLRPGMKGSAKVISQSHALGWNLFHKAWESFAMMVGY